MFIILITFTSNSNTNTKEKNSVLTFWPDSKPTYVNSLLQQARHRIRQRLTRDRGTLAETLLLSSTPLQCGPVLPQSHSTHGSGCPVLWWHPDAQSCTDLFYIYTWGKTKFWGVIYILVWVSNLQSFHICILIHIPHLHWAIMRGTVKIMGSLPEWETLRWKKYLILLTRRHQAYSLHNC